MIVVVALLSEHTRSLISETPADFAVILVHSAFTKTLFQHAYLLLLLTA